MENTSIWIYILLIYLAIICTALFVLLMIYITGKLHEDNWSISEVNDVEVKFPEVITEVICAAGTCETTIERCSECNRQLTLPRTEV